MHVSTSGECASPSDFNHVGYPFRVAPDGEKNIPCFCKGSSVRLERIGDWNEEEVFINDNGVSSWTWELRM